MKKLLILFSAFVALTFTACLKNTALYDDFSKTSPVAELPLSGIANFPSDAVTAAGDTITLQFAVNIASTNTPTVAHTITVAPDFTKIASYAMVDSSINYVAMPAAAFVFPSTTVTIPAGKTEAVLSVTFYKHLLDPSKSFMLPISITKAAGLNVSGNFGIHYYHFIGNPLAGSYLHDFTRYNNQSGLGNPASQSYVGRTSTLSPVNPTHFEAMGGYYTANIRYEVTFTNTAGKFSNFQVSLNPDDVKNIITPAGLTVATAPTITVDANNFMTITYQVQNSGGAYRTLIDRYYH